MKKTSYFKQAIILTLILAVSLTLTSTTAGRSDATVAQTTTEAKIVMYASSQIGVRETSSNYVAGKPYAQFHDAWCADFVRWVMESSGINIYANGRDGLRNSYRVARAWAYYGAAGGGYGRWATTRDAMPGDLLIDDYTGRPTAGGHISIVVETRVGGSNNLVRTVAGNESNRVNTEYKDLTRNNRYLVTLSELRLQSEAMLGGGTVVFSRAQSGLGALVKIHSVWLPGRVMQPSDVANSAYAIQATNSKTGQFEYFRGDQTIATEFYRNVRLTVKLPDGRYMIVAELTHN